MRDISKERDSLTYEDLSDKGIDMSQIAVCKKSDSSLNLIE